MQDGTEGISDHASIATDARGEQHTHASTDKSDSSVDQPAPLDVHRFDRFTLYETRTNLYLMGTERTRNTFRLLKISRTDPTVIL